MMEPHAQAISEVATESFDGKGFLDRYFEISSRGSTQRREIVAGITTFLAMVYSVFVVPGMFGKAGFDTSAVFVAVCLTTAFGSLLMGVWARLPIAIGCAISLTAFTAFGLVLGKGLHPNVALGAVFLMGVVFTAISVTGVRSWILRNLPTGIAHGTGIGIGLFLLLIAANDVGSGREESGRRFAGVARQYHGVAGADVGGGTGGDFRSGAPPRAGLDPDRDRRDLRDRAGDRSGCVVPRRVRGAVAERAGPCVADRRDGHQGRAVDGRAAQRARTRDDRRVRRHRHDSRGGGTGGPARRERPHHQRRPRADGRFAELDVLGSARRRAGSGLYRIDGRRRGRCEDRDGRGGGRRCCFWW